MNHGDTTTGQIRPCTQTPKDARPDQMFVTDSTTISYISEPQREISSDQLYNSVKRPVASVAERIRLKAQITVKYISVLKVKYEAFSRNSWSKKKDRTEFQTNLNDIQDK